MSWLQRIFDEKSDQATVQDDALSDRERMSPGLTGEYDWEAREKAGIHTPPPEPPQMGVEGEYDPIGLAKRVAIALDRTPDCSEVEGLSITQLGSTIRLKGTAPDENILEDIVEVVSRVDGVKHVDTKHVEIA